MEEKQELYDAYRNNRLTSGNKLELEHSVWVKKYDISSLITQDAGILEALRENSVECEKKAFEAAIEAARQWEAHAASTQLIDRALQYLRTPEVSHTANEWQDRGLLYAKGERISNRVYEMGWSMEENTRFDRDLQKRVPASWDVSWYVCLNTPVSGRSIRIAGQDRKHFTDRAAAEKYLEGRKTAYAGLFEELSPPVPEEYKSAFMVSGQLLPGYRDVAQSAGRKETAGQETPQKKKPAIRR